MTAKSDILFGGFVIVLICVAIFIVYVKIRNLTRIRQVTSLFRGERSERRLILELLKVGINPKAIFHDLYIKMSNGQYTQVDVVVATKVGLLVFEVKDYSGWIFGGEYQSYWTKVLAYGKKKYRFYNPVMQNEGHIKAIRNRLPQNPGIPIYSIIVFFGNCKLKKINCNSGNAAVIYPHSVRNVVKRILKGPDAFYGNKYEIMDLLTESVQNGNDPYIVSSQIKMAKFCGRNTPVPYYLRPFRSLRLFGFHRRRQRNFWRV